MLFHYPMGFFVSTLWTFINGTDHDLTCKPQYQIQFDIGNRENYCDYRLLDVVESYQHLLTPNFIILAGSRKFSVQEIVSIVLNKLTERIECDEHDSPTIISLDDSTNEQFTLNEKEQIVDTVDFSIDCLLERANKTRKAIKKNKYKKDDFRVLERDNEKSRLEDDDKEHHHNCIKCTNARECKRCDDRRRRMIQIFRLYIEVVKNNSKNKDRRRKKKRKTFSRLFLIFLHFSWTLESLT